VFPILALTFLILFQAAVTFFIWRSNIYLRSEKIAQTKLVWLVPALGATTALLVLIQESKR
jgi:hypothetical protein